MQQTPDMASHWTSPKPKICNVCFCNLTESKINPFSEGEQKIAKAQRGLIKKQLLIYLYWYEHVKPHREFLRQESQEWEDLPLTGLWLVLFSSEVSRSCQHPLSDSGENQEEPHVIQHVF